MSNVDEGGELTPGITLVISPLLLLVVPVLAYMLFPPLALIPAVVIWMVVYWPKFDHPLVQDKDNPREEFEREVTAYKRGNRARPRFRAEGTKIRNVFRSLTFVLMCLSPGLFMMKSRPFLGA